MSPSLKATSSVTCEELEAFRDAYVDGEFAGAELADIESHLEACPDCRAAVEAGRAWHRRMREVAADAGPLNPVATPRLRAAIVAGLGDEDRRRRRALLRPTLIWSAVLAAAAAAAALMVRAGVSRERASSLIAAAIDNHHRELPLEVQDAQLPRIQSWFQGKIDFAPSRIPELRKVNLIGARLSNLTSHKAAYVSYGLPGRRRVSLFVFDAPELRVPADHHVNDRDVLIANEHGYNVALWKDQEIAYSLVSDLNEKDVLELIGATAR